MSEAGTDVLTTAANQLLRICGVTKVWVREDSAAARVQITAINVIFEPPQALKCEAELKSAKDQQQRQNAQRLIQPDSQTWLC